MERVKTIEEEMQKIINKYPIDWNIIVVAAEELGKVSEKLSPSKTIPWLRDMVNRASRRSCDWCQGGAMDLVYNLKNFGVGGDIDGETGTMRVWYHGEILGSRKVRYCPMCGRPVPLNGRSS